MALIVQKFGGSSVANADRVMNVARIVTDTYKAGNDVVVVVSAQGDTTDDLIEKALEINPTAAKRELDQLLTAGEQISISLLAMAIESLGFPVISLLGWQAGFNTNSVYGSARIKNIKPNRLQAELAKAKEATANAEQFMEIVYKNANFDELTHTLLREFVDKIIVHADKCQIFTDVEGVYTADPRKVEGAKKLKEITYDEMLELATLGAQVLNNRSVEMAKKYSVELEVLSSLNPVPGTIVKEVAKMEKMLIRGVTKDKDVALVSVLGVKDNPGVAFNIFSKLSQKNINVDIILQSFGRDNTKDIVFTVSKDNGPVAVELLKETSALDGAKIVCDTNVAKVSIVGAGMESHPGTATKMFEALYERNINIRMISTSEIKISVIIDADDADRAVSAVHKAFIPND